MIIKHNSFRAGKDRFSKEDFGTEFRFVVSQQLFKRKAVYLPIEKVYRFGMFFRAKKEKYLRVRMPGKLEILGRFDNSDIRGCNLMVL